jgi:hypothetical protein
VNNPGDTQVQGDDEREGSRRLSLEGNQPPAEISGYTMIRRLGTGAYGTVWLAREDNTGRMVAVKYYPHRRGLNWSLLSREVEKLATLYTSRNIVQLLDVGWNAEPPYYVMEFVENGSLSAHMARGPLPINEAVRITGEVCRALVEAHGAGVLHCDLKPDNVLLDSSFQVRLCDFGQSRMSHERSPALGTLYYMAPEQADLEAVADARWDVYAVGALLYHMLVGVPPFRTSELQRTLESTESLNDRLATYRDAIKNSPQPTAHRSLKGVDKRLSHLIDTCLSVDPAERLPNAQAILAELEGRDQQRARRPLLLLGVLGPLLLIAAMVPLFVNALRDNLTEMTNGLTFRALESNALSARALAGALEAELEGRLTDLQDVAELEGRLTDLKDAVKPEDLPTNPLEIPMSAELIGPLEEALTQRSLESILRESHHSHDLIPDERPKWMQSLDQARSRADERNSERHHKLDVSWFLQDRHGNQLWRSPYAEPGAPTTVGKNYAWRDYFHGHSRKYDKGTEPADITPIKEPYVSLPFTSRATGQYMVALSVPVISSSGEIIGVLARTAHLADLRERLGQYIREGNHHHGDEDGVFRRIALADFRTGELLDHPWLHQQSPDKRKYYRDRLFLPMEALSKLNAARQNMQQSDNSEYETRAVEVLIRDYDDPVGQLADSSAEPYRGKWMAAMALMQHSGTPWIVVVQEPQANMLKPVEDMTREAIRTAWIAVITSILLMGIIWIFVSRAIAGSKS